MKKKFQIKYLLFIAVIWVLPACVKDSPDPLRATQDKAITSVNGLNGIAVGLQRTYTAGRANIYNTVTASGFLTKELFLLNQGNTAEFQLSVGGNVLEGGNTLLAALWANSTKLIYDSDVIISNLGVVADKTYVSGLQGYATIFKALAIGDLAGLYEKVPAGSGANATFITRIEAYNKVISEIDLALAAIAASPINPSFLSRIPAGIDIPNTLRALKARYALFAGNYPLALTTANSVNLTVKSEFRFDAITTNPMFATITNTNNIYQPVNNNLGLPVGLQPDPNDKRIPFYLDQNMTVAPLWRVGGFGRTLTGSIPVYLPGEITLIKAEAYARAGGADLANSLIEINKIVTKKAAADPFGVGADLPLLVGPLTQPQLLAEIYKQRSIEMVMSGLRLEDSRRLGRPVAERLRNFVNYPFTERDQNPNTPVDPTF